MATNCAHCGMICIRAGWERVKVFPPTRENTSKTTPFTYEMNELPEKKAGKQTF